MRDYAKVSPKMWHGRTAKDLRKRGYEALLVGLYLMTSPSSNMLGLFGQPVLYMAHETGLGLEGAMKGLKGCIEAGFCAYDEESEFVFVFEMARYQIDSELSPKDLRCKGVQKEYDNLSDNPFLGSFFDRYAAAFHMTNRRGFEVEKSTPTQAPCKPLQSQEQEQEQEQELFSESKDSGGKPPVKPSVEKSKSELWKAAVSLLNGQGMAEAQARTFIGKLNKDYPLDGIVMQAVEGAVSEQPADARAYLKATCQRLNGERKRDGGADWTETAL